jgi:hypothetical protein
MLLNCLILALATEKYHTGVNKYLIKHESVVMLTPALEIKPCAGSFCLIRALIA